MSLKSNGYVIDSANGEAASTARQWLQAADIGSEAWWQRLATTGAPLIDALPASQVCVTFIWRDEQGDERHSRIERVYADVNCVTDHHSFSPQSLARCPGTDVWYWQVVIQHDWRGSYSFIPIEREQLPPVFSGTPEEQNRRQRRWWCSLFPLMRHDPLNRIAPHRSSRGFPLSAIHLPAAPDQSAWLALDAGSASADPRRLQHFHWHSDRLANQRRIWLYTTGGEAQADERPLVLLLDGQFWAEGIPAFSALDAQTQAGALPPAVYLLIDAIDMTQRAEELPCNPLFWQAVQAELLPLVSERARYSADPQRTVVAGQSYGGLAALYAGLHWPQRFGRVLTQSGSFWWPHLEFVIEARAGQPASVGWLTEQVAQGVGAAAPLTVFQEAGDREEEIAHVNRQMNRALSAAGHRVHYRAVAGGHDAVCWRGGLIDGLKILLTS
ncbi:enterochelin esterase [Serratia ficaria]|uniref:enterochelin esterase n=1 Tax=Serratia ficaria TaxID=61651 RepID=UPI0021773FC9|nr:enterochelin esterase [Serratia ficaria]CAI1523705.1 Ferric enterobactin esterase [Serratia ficaria]